MNDHGCSAGLADTPNAWRAVRDRFHGQVPPATPLGIIRLEYDGHLVEIDATIRR